MFAEGWDKPRGLDLLKNLFVDVNPKLAKAIVLEFSSKQLGELTREDDAGAIAFKLEKGPVLINFKN